MPCVKPYCVAVKFLLKPPPLCVSLTVLISSNVVLKMFMGRCSVVDLTLGLGANVLHSYYCSSGVSKMKLNEHESVYAGTAAFWTPESDHSATWQTASPLNQQVTSARTLQSFSLEVESLPERLCKICRGVNKRQWIWKDLCNTSESEVLWNMD